MTYLDAIILGLVEGITEFLPISSTGHLILAGELLGLPSTEFLKSFDIAIQLGAILAVVALYWRSFLDVELLKKLAAAFIPTGILGFALYAIVKNVFLGNPYIVVGALFIGGIALIVFELLHTEKPESAELEDNISYPQALGVGAFQALGMIPGISRSGATIVGGLILGLSRTTIVQFSFLLAVPTMAAATGYEVLKNPEVLLAGNIGLLITGFLVSFAVALLAIRFLLAFVRTHTFISFGIYRIVASVLFFFVVLI